MIFHTLGYNREQVSLTSTIILSQDLTVRHTSMQTETEEQGGSFQHCTIRGLFQGLLKCRMKDKSCPRQYSTAQSSRLRHSSPRRAGLPPETQMSTVKGSLPFHKLKPSCSVLQTPKRFRTLSTKCEATSCLICIYEYCISDFVHRSKEILQEGKQ